MIDDGTGPGLVPLPDGKDETHPGTPQAPEQDLDATRLGAAARPGQDDAATAYLSPDSDFGRTRESGSPHTRASSLPGASANDLVGRSLGSRYRVLRLLGAGGMGAVYEAFDLTLGVAVALKTVRPEIAADPETARALERRFKQELLLARKVTHRNIVRVHDMGEVDGIRYITMPYLDGDDLSTVLKADGKLPTSRVIAIARQVASGLAAAHDAGVVHRDLKPANIMMTKAGEALIMDFGIARSTANATLAVAPHAALDEHLRLLLSEQHTVVGSVVGTVEYMAPEQAQAQPVDQRADIYAFGLILYDLLLGRSRSRRTESAIAELNLRMLAAPPSPRSVDPTIPEALDSIIARCTQPDANARYATTAELVAALEGLAADGTRLPIIRRWTWRMAGAAALVMASLIALTWWAARPPAVPIQHEPVSLLIADFENHSGDAAFDHTVEPVLKLALEGAPFVSAYDRSGIRRSLGVVPPDVLNERTAMELAVKQGVGVVLAGSVSRQRSGYSVAVKATQAVTGRVIANAIEKTENRQDVLGLVTLLATRVREALGDDTSGSSQRFAMETLSATSLEVVREYAAAMEALSQSKFEDARQRFSNAVARDPNFGLAYAGLAIAARNVDKPQDAENYIKEAMRHLDGMTERERFRTRGLFYYLTSDYQACVKEYGVLIARYAADAAARNNLALCQTHLRHMPQAVQQMRQVVKILPNRALYRENLALYEDYAGEFTVAEQQVRGMQEPGVFGLVALAFAELGQERLPEAEDTYQSIAKVDQQGASYTASGLGDLRVIEGRFSAAVDILSKGADANMAAGDTDRAAAKFAALARAQLARGRTALALTAADKALANSNTVKIRFLAARVYIDAGAPAKGRAIAAGLASEVQVEPRAYAAILEGMAALNDGEKAKATAFLIEANRLLDTWIGHLELGRVYLAAAALPQAEAEFDQCISRRGEALALFLDEEPTFGFFPVVYFYQGQVRDGLKNARAAESYGAYLDLRGQSTEDPLVVEARRRAPR